MDYKLIRRLISDKLHDRGTYILAFVIGTMINLYGQLLVPWLRDRGSPLEDFITELQSNTSLSLFSIFIAYAFPFCVGTYSVVAARYKNRRMESIAEFPEQKPDPVFRATREGQLLEVGAETQRLFDRHNVAMAQHIIGDEMWAKISSGDGARYDTRIHFDAEGVDYLVTSSQLENTHINIYMTRLTGSVNI